MTVCPQCHTVHGREHNFCQRCGNPLVAEDKMPHGRCANCGADIFPGQLFCTACGQRLRDIGATRRPVRPAPKPEIFYGPPPAKARPVRTRGGIWWKWGLGLVLLAFGLGLYWWWPKSEPRRPVPVLPSSPATPAPRPELLQREVERLAEKIRTAHLNKDMNLFLGCYAPSYPNLGELERQTFETWKNYDFRSINYHLGPIRQFGPRHATAEIIWNFQLYNQQSKTYELHRSVVSVSLEEIDGTWKIRESKDVG